MTSLPDEPSETPPDWTWEELMEALAKHLVEQDTRVRELKLKQVQRGLFAAYPPTITVAELRASDVSSFDVAGWEVPVIAWLSWFTDEDGVEEIREKEYQEFEAKLEEDRNWAGYYGLSRQTYRFSLKSPYVEVSFLTYHGTGRSGRINRYRIFRGTDEKLQFEFAANLGLS